MRNYWVYCEIFDKKFKVKVSASTMFEAKMKVKDKMIFHKVEQPDSDEFNSIMDLLDGFHDLIKNKNT